MAEHFVGITDKGKLRQNNEDTFIVQEIAGKKLVAACVIDGVGGYNGGEVAAEIARSVIIQHLQHLQGDVIKSLREAIVAANTKILEEKEKNNKNDQMACVLTCAVTDIKNNKFFYAHVGDTRLYLLRDQSLIKVSKDHSVVGFLEESGRLSEEEAMRHPKRNEINKALGFEENINDIDDFIETGESPFLPGDVILLCSDGLSDMISSNTIMSILVRDIGLTEKARELVNAANAAGGTDNITAALIENFKQPSRQVALKPAERKKETKDPALYVSKHPLEKKTITPGKKKHGLITFLTLLSLGILAILLFQNNTKSNRNDVNLKAAIGNIKDEKLNWLMSHINDSSKTYELPQDGHAIKLSEPVLISKDTFVLKGNGTIITCDSNYKVPAVIVNNRSKYIVLDSVVFKDFDVAIAIQKNNVVLRNVRFINCRVPVQYDVAFPDSTVTGKFRDSILIPINLK